MTPRDADRIARTRAQILRGGAMAVWREKTAPVVADPEKPWIVTAGSELAHDVAAVVLTQGGAMASEIGFQRGTDFVQGKRYAIVAVPAVNAETFAPTVNGNLVLADGTSLVPFAIDPFRPSGVAYMYVVELRE